MTVAADARNGAVDELMPDDQDLLYEEELLRNPYSLKMWWRYIHAKIGAPAKRRYLLYERSLRALPGSYKVCGSRKHASTYTFSGQIAFVRRDIRG
jgi:pre-mRNA-splicing factor SYF1